ncbi:MAG: hypothetical protein OEY09_18230 [Gammaproteobacteria bacterium]|nr:hypothetical protein [Gammaproteobacteria bacterium]
MKKFQACVILLLAILPFTESRANSFMKTEAMLIALAGISAVEPETAAVVDALLVMSVSSSPEYQTNTQRTIAFFGFTALALYNHDAEDEGYTEEEIFTVNLVVFNIVMASELSGLNDRYNNFKEVDKSASSFGFQLSRQGQPGFSWQYQF